MLDFLRSVLIAILTWEARLALLRYKPRVIAVTGSVGKTTTKDAIYAALSPHVRMRKSEKSYNTPISVPLAVLGLPNAWNNPLRWLWNILRGLAVVALPNAFPEWLVVEIGADRPGDIRASAKWLRPDIAVFTGVPDIPPHVEYFASPEEVMKEKRSLAEYLRPGGKLVVNGDDMRSRQLHGDFRGVSVTYGTESNSDFFASHDEILYEDEEPAGIRFRANHGASSLPVSVFGALGRPRIYAALAAIAVGDCIGIDSVRAAQSLAAWEPPPGRVRLVAGVKYTTIIDDTYNSSPAAALAALDILGEVRTSGSKVAVLGDMLELGRYTKDAHRKVGERAAEVADALITVGFRSRAMAEGALDGGLSDAHIRQYDIGEAERAAAELIPELRKGDVVLVKGSQAVRMEKAVKLLMRDPEKAEETLVRMESEWQNV